MDGCDDTEMGIDQSKAMLYKFRQLNQLIHDSITIYGKENGLMPGIIRVLLPLNKYKSMSQIELCRKINIKPSSMTDILKKVEKLGFITRTHDELDQRRVNVIITYYGEEYAKKAIEMSHKIERKCFCGFTDSEKELYFKLTEKIIVNLESMLSEKGGTQKDV